MSQMRIPNFTPSLNPFTNSYPWPMRARMHPTQPVSIPRGLRTITVCGIIIIILLLLLLLLWTNIVSVNMIPESPSIQHVEERQQKRLDPVTSMTTLKVAENERHKNHPTPVPVTTTTTTTLKVVLLSDTHGHHRELTDVPNGDVLIFAGDITYFGRQDQVIDFNNWLGDLPHRHKFVVAGNHDGIFRSRRRGGNKTGNLISLADLPPLLTNAHYLQDSGFTFRAGGGKDNDGTKSNGDGDTNGGHVVRIWGSPWQPQYRAFETYRPSGPSGMADRWSLVPDDTTLLISHTPPAGIMDGDDQGCVDLAARIERLKARQGSTLRLVAFGHFHEYGTLVDGDGVMYVNCAVTNDDRHVVQNAHVVSLELGGH